MSDLKIKTQEAISALEEQLAIVNIRISQVESKIELEGIQNVKASLLTELKLAKESFNIEQKQDDDTRPDRIRPIRPYTVCKDKHGNYSIKAGVHYTLGVVVPL
jgi:hypothetical protein